MYLEIIFQSNFFFKSFFQSDVMCLVRAGETSFSLFGSHNPAPFLIAEEKD